MRDTWQLVGYAVAVTSIVISLALGTRYGLLEAARYLPESAVENPASNRSAELASVGVIRDANVQPVWIVPTPKYQYDPRLMEIKPRHQLTKEAELRRAKELASFQAKKREAQLKRDRGLRQARESYAYASEQRRPDFELFPFVR